MILHDDVGRQRERVCFNSIKIGRKNSRRVTRFCQNFYSLFFLFFVHLLRQEQTDLPRQAIRLNFLPKPTHLIAGEGYVDDPAALPL